MTSNPKPLPEGDIATKLLLSFKPIAALTIKAGCPAFANKSIDEIIDSIEGDIELWLRPEKRKNASLRVRGENTEALEDGNKIVFDSLFTVRCNGEPILMNIEVQADRNPGYDFDSRITFYMGRGVSMQKGRGIFRGSDYTKLQKFYSLWLFISPTQAQEGQTDFGTLAVSRRLASGETVPLPEETARSKMGYAKIYLPKGDMTAVDGNPMNILGVLFRNRGVPGKKQFLENNGIFVDEPLEEALESMYTIEDSIRDEFRKEFQDEFSKKTARDMLSEGLNIDLIERLTGLTRQVIEKLKKDLLSQPTTQNPHLQPA